METIAKGERGGEKGIIEGGGKGGEKEGSATMQWLNNAIRLSSNAIKNLTPNGGKKEVGL